MATGLDGRHRDKNGQISRKHGNTLVGTLRATYGIRFAEGCEPTEKLSDVSAQARRRLVVEAYRGHAGRLRSKRGEDGAAARET